MTQHGNNMPEQALVDFGRVDQSTYPQHFVQFLEQSQTNDMIQVIKQQSYSLLAASVGQSLLDIGCGIGDDVRAFARLVGKQGRAVGVDRSQTMIDAANKRSAGCDLPGEFYVGDVHRLEFADATFDGCRAERVLLHCDDPTQTLSEMARVVRPGGRVVAIEPDLDSVITHLSKHELARKLTQIQCDLVRNGWIGRRLPGLFHQGGLTDIQVVPNAVCYTHLDPKDQNISFLLTKGQSLNMLTRQEAEEIMHDLQQLEECGQYFQFGIFFSVIGRKG